MTRLLLFLFSFSLPLGGISTSILGVNPGAVFALLLIIAIVYQNRLIILSKGIFFLFGCMITLFLMHAFRDSDALLLAVHFTYYLLIGIILGSFSEKHQLKAFYSGFVYGIITVCLIFFLSLFNGGVDNAVIEWQFGWPVNLSGFGNPNGWAPFLILAVAANDYLYGNLKVSRRFLNRHFIFQSVILSNLFFTYSRASILSVIFYYAVAYYKTPRVFLNFGFLLTLILTALLIQNYFLPEFGAFEAGTIISNKAGSIDARGYIFSAVKEFPWDNFLIGNGYGTGKYLVQEITGYQLSLHNAFLAVLVELGFVQFVVFLIICIHPFILLSMGNRKIPLSRSPDRFIFTAILAFYLMWMLHESYINTAFWAFYFCSLLHIRHSRKNLSSLTH